MTSVDTTVAVSRLPELLDCVAQGDLIVIARNARQASRARAAFFGSMKGQVDMSRFDESDEEIAREFGMLD